MAVTMSYDDQMSKILDDNTTEKYYIEYEGFKTNHLSQSLLAFWKIKAPIEDVKKFVQWIKKEKLEDTATHKDEERSRKSPPKDPFEVLGKRQYYYYLQDYYARLLEERHGGSVEKLIAGEFPKLSAGVLAAATHGLIHTGYGYAARKGWFVVEGLAYLHDSYIKPVCSKNWEPETLGTGYKDILEVLGLVRNDSVLTTYMKDASEKYHELYESQFERRMYALYANKGDKLARYVHMIKFPSGLDGKELTMDKVVELAKWIVNCAIVVYATATRKNDFFLLHGVTSSWALKNILPVLANCQDVLRTTHDYLVALFTVYLVQDYPDLDTNLLKENKGMSYTWDTLIHKAIVHEDREREHMSKLIQVCKMMSDENPGSDMESMYRLAAHVCVDYTFVF